MGCERLEEGLWEWGPTGCERLEEGLWARAGVRAYLHWRDGRR